MIDGGTPEFKRSLIAFLFCRPKGTVLLKSDDALYASEAIILFYNLFRKFVVFMSSYYVVQMAQNLMMQIMLLNQLVIGEKVLIIILVSV